MSVVPCRQLATPGRPGRRKLSDRRPVFRLYRTLLRVDDARQLARFMGYFLAKLAKEVGRLTGWRQKIFGRRYQHIVVSDEEVEQIRRFRYVLSHGVKENLVETLREWPGLSPIVLNSPRGII